MLYDNHPALMVDEADELYAVWDGKPARSYGATADVVAHSPPPVRSVVGRYTY